MRTNSLRDRNRFNLAPPPAWWLQQLRDFDTSLVVIPSRIEAVYWIAQRRPMADAPAMASTAALMSPDEAMFRHYGLVGVTKLLSVTGAWNWTVNIFPQLALRAGWRMGLSPEQSGHAADLSDAAETATRRAALDDRLMSQIRWSEQVAKWHTGKKLLVKDPTRARLAQRATSEPSGSTAP